MSEVRSVILDREQVAVLEQLGEDMLRRQDVRASKVLAIVLAWRWAGRREIEGSENVVELHGWSRKLGA